MRVTALLLLALAATFSFAQTVTVSTTQPIGRLLDDLAKKTNLHLQAAANVRDDVVLLSCKDAASDDVMARVAAVLHAQWTKSGENYILSRDSNLVLADRKAEFGAAAVSLRTQLNELMAQVRAQGTMTPEQAKQIVEDNAKAMEAMMNGGGSKGDAVRRFESAQTKSPGSRAVIRMLAAMSDSELANMASGRRVVFSSRSTRMQLPMPNGAFDAARTFVREQQLIAAATPPPANNGETKIVIGGFSDGRMGTGNPNDMAVVILVMNDGGPLGGSGMARVAIADSKGETICSGSFGLKPSPPLPANGAPSVGEKPISLSPLTVEFDKAMVQSAGADGGMKRIMAFSMDTGGAKPSSASFVISPDSPKTPQIPLSPDLRKALLSPDKVEPLSFSTFEGMRAIAGDQNLCAYLPDGLVVPVARFMAGGDRTPSALKAFTARVSDLQYAEDGKWMTVQPRRAFSARDKRVSRLGLTNLLHTMTTKQALSLEDVSAYAATQPKSIASSDFDLAYAHAVATALSDEMLTPLTYGGEWAIMRFYGQLSPTQRQALLAGRPLPINSLSPDQVAILADQVYQSPDGPTSMSGGNGTRGMRFMIGGESVSNERTFVLPNGLPNDGFVRMSSSNQPTLQGTEADGTIREMSADQLAFSKYQSEHPETVSNLGAPPSIPSSFRQASQTIYNLQVVLGQNYGIQRSLKDTAIGNGSFVAFDQLPRDIREQVQQRLDALRQGMRSGFGGGGKVPPPQL